MQDQKDITLYVGTDYVSAFAMSAFVALTEKEIPFEIKKISLKTKENYLPEYRNVSLTCKVPALVHNGFALSESSAISEYLDEIFPAPNHKLVLPKGIQQRARARQLQAWLRSDLLVVRRERPADLIYFGKKDNALSEEASVAVERLLHIANTLLDGGSGNLFGDWSIADTDLAIMLNRLVANGDDVPANLKVYVQQQWSRNSVQLWVKKDRSAA